MKDHRFIRDGAQQMLPVGRKIETFEMTQAAHLHTPFMLLYVVILLYVSMMKGGQSGGEGVGVRASDSSSRNGCRFN